MTMPLSVLGRREPYPERLTILDLLGASVVAYPRRTAVRFADKCVTYRELNRMANALAVVLKGSGLKRGDIVAVLIGNSLELPIAWLAAIKLGAVLVPFDPAWPPERIIQGLHHIGARVALTVPASANLCRHAIVVQLEALESDDDRILLEQLSPDDLIYGFFTSGSTGTPKCALNYHRGLTNRFCYMTRHFSDCERKTVLLNSRHVFDSAVWQLLWPLTVGGEVIIPAQAGHLDLMQTIAAIERYGVTMTDFVPSIFNVLAELAQADANIRSKLASLRWLLIGGEEINVKAVSKFRRVLPHVRLTNTYGPTEAAIGMIFHDIGEDDNNEIPLGQPIHNTFVTILDENLRVVPVGSIGEICISGECLGAGYLNDPEKTKSAFIESAPHGIPYKTLYRTGDLGYQDGRRRIHFAGRLDTQVKVNGIRVELGEIEHALLRHESVREAVVLAVADASSERKKLCAFVVLHALTAVDRLREHVRGLLPNYLVPAEIHLLLELPLTPNGKVDRAALAASLKCSVVQKAGEARSLSKLEVSLLEIFRRLVASEIDIDDDFFEKGGDSLSALEVVLAVKAEAGVDLLVSDIYAHPTARTLARILTRATPKRKRVEAEAWQADISLVQGISVPDRKKAAPPQQILITGATGFVGAHLLSALLQSAPMRVFALVRAPDDASAFARCRAALERHDLWQDAFMGKLSAISGDLCKPRLGVADATWAAMEQNIDSIVHCGAMVDFLRTYDEHRPPNVLGTLEVVRLATAGCGKHVHYISTLSTFESGPCPPAGLADIGLRSDARSERSLTGYVQSKLVGEHFIKTVQAAGLTAHVYRLGEVGPSLVTRTPNERSFLTLLLKSCIHLRAYPSMQLSFECTPVNAVAELIARCVRDGIGGTLDIFQKKPLSFDQVVHAITAMGIVLQPVSYQTVTEALRRQSSVNDAPRELKLLRTLLSRHSDCQSLMSEFNETHQVCVDEGFQRFIERNEIVFPRLDEAALACAVIERSSARLVAGKMRVRA